jgi:hypothetical protein
MPVPILPIVTTDDYVLDKSVAGANAASENLVQNTSETEIIGAPSSLERDNFLVISRWISGHMMIPWRIFCHGPRLTLISTNASILVGSVGPPSAKVCRTTASFP